MEVINVKTSTFESKIYIGEDIIDTRLPLLTKTQKNFVVTDSNVYALYSDFFKKYFPNTELFVLPAGEENKTFQSLNAILLKMAEAGLHRTSRLFAVGGGVVGDIAGLAAALFMRGISCVQIPTTLLSQVDSSVGGKTAVDLGGIKNVVGAFYQPCEVLINPNFLKTLPMRELKCGIGEIVKYAALSSSIFDTIEQNTEQLTNLSFLTKLIKDCVAHKAQVVGNDEKETGERKSLNVGHTTGHAIELTHNLSHGECVLYGMLFETRMAITAGVCEENYGKRLLTIIEKALAIEPSEEIDVSNIEQDAEKARLDKKNADDGKIKMAVAKNYGEWTMYSLPFEEYRKALKMAL